MENSEVVEVEVNKKNDKKVSIEDVRNAVGFLGRKVEAVVNILEKQFGIDLNKDGKIGLGVILAVLVGISSASAANVWKVGKSGAEVYVNTAGDIHSDGSISASGAVYAGGAVTFGGNVISSGTVSSVGTSSQYVTNGQLAVVLQPGVNIITPRGQADVFTNTVTLANATPGYRYDIIVASAASNLLEIADSGNVRLTATFDGNANDVLSLYGYSTNYVETGRNEN